jgi:hypothetical protein
MYDGATRSDQGSWETGSPVLRLGNSAIPSKQSVAEGECGRPVGREASAAARSREGKHTESR